MEAVNCRDAVLRYDLNDTLPLRPLRIRIWGKNESGISRVRNRSDRLFNRSHIVHADDGNLYAQGVGARLHARQETLERRRFGFSGL